MNCTAIDPALNASTCSFTVTVEDNTAPSISCPGDITVSRTSPTGAIVNFTTPTASDNCDDTLAVVCDPASGSLFGEGITTVACVATDAD
ncbi:MAG: HYR domain-containing protein, partial [bacterium]|nr:HYR domain-containing protein [bacterium]